MSNSDWKLKHAHTHTHTHTHAQTHTQTHTHPLKTDAIDKRFLDKWDYSCNQNLSYQKSFASTKTF